MPKKKKEKEEKSEEKVGYKPFDYVYTINQNKNDLSHDNPFFEKEYNAWTVNKALSYFLDTVMFAQEMNLRYTIPKKQQYQFYLNSVEKRKRFSPWIKNDPSDDLRKIMNYYECNILRAKKYLEILTPEQLEYIRSSFEIGGRTKK